MSANKYLPKVLFIKEKMAFRSMVQLT